MAYDETRVSSLKMFTRMFSAMGAVFGLVGILLLYWYVYEAFPDLPNRIGWWATISIVLCLMLLLGYAIASDMVRSLERDARRKLSDEKPERAK